MAKRVIKAVNEDVTAPEATVSKARKEKRAKDEKCKFRTPHPGLQVVLKGSERIDHGAGQYEIIPPELAEFENMGNYGEFVCDPDVAEVLRSKSAERKALHLPLKYTEV